VRAVSAARFHALLGPPPKQLILAWQPPGTAPEVVVLTRDAADALHPLLAVPARGFTLEDATGDGVPDLVVQASRGRALAVAPVVYRATNGRLEPTLDGTAAFYARHLRELDARIAAPPPPGADASHTNDRLVDLLDRGLTLEVLSRPADAFRTYQALLTRAALPTRVTRDDAAANASTLEITREARTALAKLAGLRLVGDPRPSPGPR